jgi:hypothetical protein
MAPQHFCITVGFRQSGHIKADSRFVQEVVLVDQNVIDYTSFFQMSHGYVFGFVVLF